MKYYNEILGAYKIKTKVCLQTLQQLDLACHSSCKTYSLKNCGIFPITFVPSDYKLVSESTFIFLKC